MMDWYYDDGDDEMNDEYYRGLFGGNESESEQFAIHCDLQQIDIHSHCHPVFVVDTMSHSK